MNSETIVEQLTEAANQLGWEVRFEKGDFRGGRCVIDGKPMILLNKRHSADLHVTILAESLSDQPLDNLYLPPAVRSAVEDVWERSNETVNTEEA